MSRLASIGARAVHQPLTLAIYNQLQASTDWDYVPGAALTTLTGGNTLNITSRHHHVTIVGGTIDNIADASGASEGQLLELYCTGATTIRNAGGGTGNIRSISGADLAIVAGDIVELVYDGTNWRECARGNMNLPANGILSWGTDTTLTRASAGTLTANGGLATNSSTFGAGGSGNTGLYADNAGRVQGTSSATLNFLATSRTGETQFRWVVDNVGNISWGPGGSTAPDTVIGRTAAGILAMTTGNGLGYAVGTGGVGTTTACTINKPTGQVQATVAVGTGASASYTVTNSTVTAADTVIVCLQNGTSLLLYQLVVNFVAAGSFQFTFYNNSGASLTPKFNFCVIKGAQS